MEQPPLLADEQERLRALRKLEILETGPEPFFDRIARLASALIGIPISLVSLVDEDRQWFKARVGLDAAETPRNISFCGHAIAQNDPFVVLDTLLDPRFRDNPLVAGSPGIRFYAGAPLRRDLGSALGTLCVIDTRPHASFSPRDAAILTELAGLVTEQMEQRLRNLQHENVLRASQERAALLRGFYDALQSAQSRFIGGGESDEVFGGLLKDLIELTGSSQGCLADTEAGEGNPPLRVIAGSSHPSLLAALRQAISARGAYSETALFAVPGRHGLKVAGALAFAGADYRLLGSVLAELQPFLIGLGGLFDASRARREGRRNAETIRLRERALSSINSAVSIVDPKRGGTIIYCNSAFERMSGFSADEVVGRGFNVIYGPETDAEAIRQVDEA
ncbi:MAG: GAF domain-containing protein, partial [Acidobacteriota bacterium]